jgi:DNA uptake protein ComE-like DNA-binding protein
VLIAWALLLAGGVSAGQDKLPAALPAQAKAAAQPVLVDINSATPAKLRTLPWIGEAEAQRIVAGRPYPSKASLVTRKIIPAGVYQEIRHRIIAIQHGAPAQPASRATSPATK